MAIGPGPEIDPGIAAPASAGMPNIDPDMELSEDVEPSEDQVPQAFETSYQPPQQRIPSPQLGEDMPAMDPAAAAGQAAPAGQPQAPDVTDLRAPTPTQRNFGMREDGTPKGMGWLGLLKRPDGKVSSELSVGVEINGKETLLPLFVPTLMFGIEAIRAPTPAAGPPFLILCAISLATLVLAPFAAAAALRFQLQN